MPPVAPGLRCAIYKSTLTLPAKPQFFTARLASPCQTLAPAIQIENRYVSSMFLPHFQRNATRKSSYYRRAEAPASFFYFVNSIRFGLDNITNAVSFQNMCRGGLCRSQYTWWGNAKAGL